MPKRDTTFHAVIIALLLWPTVAMLAVLFRDAATEWMLRPSTGAHRGASAGTSPPDLVHGGTWAQPGGGGVICEIREVVGDDRGGAFTIKGCSTTTAGVGYGRHWQTVTNKTLDAQSIGRK
jgi:hypothetical protein